MAGRPETRARKQFSESVAVKHREDFDACVGKIVGWFPELADKAMELARGVSVQIPGIDGPKVYARPPSIIAIMYLMDRVMGKPATAPNPIDQHLNEMRALFIATQLKAGILDAQAAELAARARRTELDIEMLPQQFVTEADEEERLRKAIMAMNEGVLKLTPEQFRSIAPEVSDPANVLQQLKGLVGRSQSDALSAAFGEETIEEDEEEDG